MFKYLIVAAVSAAAGAGASWYGFSNLANTAQQAAIDGWNKVEEERYDACQRDFYKETSCLQHDSQVNCEKQLNARCGLRQQTQAKTPKRK